MRRSLIPAATLVAALAGSLALAPTAFATGGDNEITLNQKLPLTAADAKPGECPDSIPANQDGWHFVLPGNKGEFVKLEVTFEPGGTQVIEDFSTFGNPKGKHAYVASPAGATLTAASATIKGTTPQDEFQLSHTCAAEGEETTGGNTTGETTTGETTTGETTGETTTGETTTGETTGETTTGETTTGETTGETTTGETTTGETTGETTTGETTTGETT
ncbi:LPXTG cell wall anchor domain-containing protein, partial [Streptomyces filamentosus]|uniref:LPXTG cell wall anchor domain-containing protein n=1 Tax=Streptomyces filamentosus TaxID=67294 RepID=UPI0033F16E7B